MQPSSFSNPSTTLAASAAEDRLRRLLESITDGVCAVDADWRFTFLNEAARRIFAPHTLDDPQSWLGKCYWELFPEACGTIVEQEYRRAIAEQTAVAFEVFCEPRAQHFDIRAYPVTGGGLAIFFRDITAEQRPVKTAHASVERDRSQFDSVAELETLLEVLPIGIGISQDAGLRVNPAFARILGLPDPPLGQMKMRSEVPSGLRVTDDAGAEIAACDLPMQIAAREGREVREVEITIARADGTSVRLLEYAAPIFGENGAARGAVAAFVDITERRAAEELHRFLVRLDDAVRPLSDSSEITAVAARLLGELIGADRCAYADMEADEDTMNLSDYCRGVPSIAGRYTFTQFGSECLRAMRANEAYVVGDIETYQPAPENLEAYRQTLIRSVICVPLHKSGKFVAAMAVHQTVPRRWRENEVALVLSVANRCWEALERARVTRNLGESEERFRALADNIAQLAWMADSEGSIFWYNQRWFDYTGTTLEQMQGWGWQRVHDPAHLERIIAFWRNCLTRGESWEDTFPLRGADGQYRWFLSRAFPIRDAAGKVLRWFGTNTDVTEQRAVVEALARAKEQAEAASRAKDDFLAALSHELRTPLTPVLMAAEELCSDPALPAPMLATLSMMRRNIALEARLIDDLLDLTRIARGQLALREQECDVHALIHLATDIVRDDAQTKGLALALELEAGATQLTGDPARLQQVFWNLLKNALKFTHPGGVITVRTRNENARVIVEVSDTGIGIAPEALDLLFAPFEQAGLANNHRFGGLGLGLSISRKIVELHQGTIIARSAGPGTGATFIVELPVVPKRPELPSVAQKTPESRPIPGRPQRLLVVEDHEPTLAVLSRLLTRAGYQVFPASTVASALLLAAEETVDAVVSDIGLPDGSGIDLMGRLRTTYGLRGIALSGYGMDEDTRRSREAGFVEHLVKPVDFSQLREALVHLAPTTSAERHAHRG